jgi:hypothetical protein
MISTSIGPPAGQVPSVVMCRSLRPIASADPGHRQAHEHDETLRPGISWARRCSGGVLYHPGFQEQQRLVGAVVGDLVEAGEQQERPSSRWP